MSRFGARLVFSQFLLYPGTDELSTYGASSQHPARSCCNRGSIRYRLRSHSDVVAHGRTGRSLAPVPVCVAARLAAQLAWLAQLAATAAAAAASRATGGGRGHRHGDGHCCRRRVRDVLQSSVGWSEASCGRDLDALVGLDRVEGGRCSVGHDK